MDRLSDNELMLAVAAGDSEPLNVLYRRWRPKVTALCYSMVGEPELAADLAQEVFLRILRYRRSFRGESSFGTWLYTLSRRVCLDRIAKGQRVDEIGAALRAERTRTSPVHPARIHRLRRAFESLEPEQRELLTLHRLQGWKFREIAELWGMSEGTLRTRSHRALKALRDRFEQLERQEHDF